MRRFRVVLLTFVLSLAVLGVTQTQAQYSYFATVTAYNLNVRTAPTTNAGVIAVISGNYTYPVIGRTSDYGWYLLAMSPTDSVTGWASGSYLSVPGAQYVPVVNPPGATPANISMGTVTAYNLNVRGTPDPYNGVILTRITGGQVFPVIGRNNIGTRWWQIRLTNGTTGWVNGRYLNVTNDGLVPITDNTTNPAPSQAYGTVTSYFLNVRSAPNPYVANVILVIARNQTFPVIGRNAAGTWWQINVGNGITGWVRGSYFPVVNGHLVPITG